MGAVQKRKRPPKFSQGKIHILQPPAIDVGSLHLMTVNQFDIDTGAEESVISKARHEKIGSPPLLQPSRTLRGPRNYPLPVTGCFTGKLKRGSQEMQQEIFVVRNLRQQLLGRPAIGCTRTCSASWGHISQQYESSSGVPTTLQWTSMES